MIDYIKARIINREQILDTIISEKEINKVESKFNFTNGKPIFPLITKRENLLLKITEKNAYLENSIHKYNNILSGEGNQNYNDFSYIDLVSTIEYLEDNINYNLENTIITNLEFGFNIDIGTNPTILLQNNILMYDFKAPCYEPKNDPLKKIIKHTYEEYEIKIYNKSLHFKNDIINKNILRVEVKYKSKKLLNRLGIYNISDLKKSKNMYSIFNDFLKKFDKLFIIDSLDGNSNMSKKDKQFYMESTNPNYWIKIKNKYSRNVISNKKREFNKLIKKYKLDTWKIILEYSIKNKFNKLMNDQSVELY